MRTVVRVSLQAAFPINLWCGDELLLIYNDAYRRVLGSKHPEALGRPGSTVWSEIWPQISVMFDGIRAGGPAVFADDAPFMIERADNEAAPPTEPNAWFTFSLSPVHDEAGDIVAFVNIVSETTGRIAAEREREAALAAAERAEARLREIFVQAPAFMAVLRGDEHVFEYVNAAYYQLVGHRELLGRPVFDALPEVRGQGFEKLLDGVVETGEPFVGREVAVMVSREPDSEPEKRYVDLIYYPITEPDGTRSGVVAHGSDVTEHVLARIEAQDARTEAEEANLAKSQFLANMSHEIRTPINAVMGYADLLEATVAGPLSDRQAQFVDRIRSSSRHLLGLVNDVLDLSKIEAGETVVQVEPTPIESVTSAALAMVAPQAEASGIDVRTEGSCDGATHFLGDEDRTRQILLNLLSNALKFTGRGGRITVACRVVVHAPTDAYLSGVGPWLLLEVTDTGKGIPPEEQLRIFNAFVQVDGGHTRSTGGTGLGLTISRRLARLMDGDLTVRSKVGEGSTFSLWLRAATASAGATSLSATSDHSSRAIGYSVVGEALIEVSRLVEEELVSRLGADPHIVGADRVERAQLADHTAALLAAIGRGLTALDTDEPVLIAEGAEIQRHLAERHGRQRHRLGWSRAALEGEYRTMHELIDIHMRRTLHATTGAYIGRAFDAAHSLIDRAADHSLAAFDHAGS